jgi:hypothetical protein
VLKSKAIIEQTTSIWQKRILFNTFTAKAKMHYESGDKNLDFVANIRMKKDSIIWVSVTVAGIVQVARAVITPDSFKAVLYTEKEAYQGLISNANKILPEGLDFYSLQNLLVGNPILTSTSPSSASDEIAYWVLRLVEKNYIEQLQYNKGDSTLSNNQLISQGISKNSLHQSLSNFVQVLHARIAIDRKINIQTDSSSILVDMNYSNLNLDTELSYPFSIPKNYTLK